MLAEFYGWVSFAPGADGEEPADLRAKVDFTDVTAEDNPDWRIDLNDDVIGGWTHRRRPRRRRDPDLGPAAGPRRGRGDRRARRRADRPGPGRRRALHPGRGRRGARLRRRPLPRGQALGSLGAPARRPRASTRTPSRTTRSRRGDRAEDEPLARRRRSRVVCVVGSAVAVWLVVIDDGRGRRRRRAGAAGRRRGRGPAEADEPAKPGAIHFTVSASGDLLMHQPLLDRALANGGGGEYDFAPFFDRDRALRGGGRPRPLPHGDADGPGPAVDLSDLQHARPASRPRSTAAAGTPATPPRTTRSTRARRGSTAR